MKIKLDDFCQTFNVTEKWVIDNLPFEIKLEDDILVFYVDLNDYESFVMSSTTEALQSLV